MAAYEADNQPAAALEVALLLGDEQAIFRLTRIVSSTALGAHYLLRIPRACAIADPDIAMRRAFMHYARSELAACRDLIDKFPADAPVELVQTVHILLFMFLPPREASNPVVFLPRFITPAIWSSCQRKHFAPSAINLQGVSWDNAINHYTPGTLAATDHVLRISHSAGDRLSRRKSL